MNIRKPDRLLDPCDPGADAIASAAIARMAAICPLLEMDDTPEATALAGWVMTLADAYNKKDAERTFYATLVAATIAPMTSETPTVRIMRPGILAALSGIRSVGAMLVLAQGAGSSFPVGGERVKADLTLATQILVVTEVVAVGLIVGSQHEKNEPLEVVTIFLKAASEAANESEPTGDHLGDLTEEPEEPEGESDILSFARRAARRLR